MQHIANRGADIARLILTTALCLILASAAMSSSAQRSAVFEERASALANEMAHVNADQARAAVEVASIRAKLEAMDDQLIQIKAYGAALAGLLTVLQIISAVTGRRIRMTEQGER